ncbi:hypothetical protein RIF29_41458 [Crotalaria pallida]|uniref:At1g61320/AtMIF1 LRR domain-containing protein n=1 Tax=Crotalaria pallida TaxID=3830 RepID=A0AAN9E536_CROPI
MSALPTSAPASASKKDAHPHSPSKSLPNYLDGNIMHHVFSLLPLKDHIELSTLAKEFTKSWTHNRKLLFGDKMYPGRPQKENLVPMIDRVFNSHNGPVIDSFQLQIDPKGVEELIEKWLRICITKGIKELYLSLSSSPDFILIPEFLNIPTLKVLKIESCDIEVPPVVTGLRNLHTLGLRSIIIKDGELETLILNMKMLINLDLGFAPLITRASFFLREHKHFRALKIANCFRLVNIEIDCPTLQCFHYRGPAINMQFYQVMPLVDATFVFITINNRDYVPPSRIQNLANQALHARVLTTSAQFQEALTSRYREGVLQESQFRFSNVRELHMAMVGGMFCNPYDIIMFAKNCPSVEKLFIDLNDYTLQYGVYWEMHQMPRLQAFNHYFDQLKIIKLIGIRFSRAEIHLLEILLKRSRFLETLIFISPKYARKRIMKPLVQRFEDLINSWKAPGAKVIAFDHHNDESGIYPSHEHYWS